jgi:N-acyl-D-amino-acid deacylase
MSFDVILRNGTLYDGNGGAPFQGDLGIQGETIAAIGTITEKAPLEIDATGLAVAPGFINMMCWANESLIEDGRSQSDIRQGVTLEVHGEGWSMGPLNEEMKKDMKARQGDIRYEIEWTTLDEYLQFLVDRGVSCNVASFIGSGSVRAHAMGWKADKPTAAELAAMQDLIRQAMADGALGMSAALIYPPGCFADTEELIALARAVAEYDGIYITHLRSEGKEFLEAVDEFLRIVREAKIRGEIYHLKAAGRKNWHKLDAVIEKVERARAEGLPVTADMYTYHASSTGLDAIMPDWVKEGGHDAWVKRLQDPDIRRQLIKELSATDEDGYYRVIEAGKPEHIILASFKKDHLKPLTGKTLAEVAAMRGKNAIETALDLVVEDNSRIGAVFFTMSEENVRKGIALPWVSFNSDSASLAPEGVFLKSNPHPRAYGSFARLLGKYVRDEKIIPLTEAIRRLAALPADVLKLDRRGRLLAGHFADVAIFDPAKIQDHATVENPHQYATGMVHVFVNGVQVLRDGDHTGALPGQVVRGPGWRGRHAEPGGR